MISQPYAGAPSPGAIHFEKYEGLGNDFLIVDGRSQDHAPLPLALRVAICDRHTGVGADGVLTVLAPRSADAKVRMHITNSDGSEPEMCGNGLRCLMRWLYAHGEVQAEKPYWIDTDAGLHECWVTAKGVRVRMPAAKFADDILGHAGGANALTWGTESFAGTAVSMGNPHWVMPLAKMPVETEISRVGPLLSVHPDFPNGTNVGFAVAEDSNTLRLVVWERGAGFTQACGTGACAAVAALVQAGRFACDEDIRVLLPGGTLFIRIPSDGSCVWMSGPARAVFVGQCASDGWPLR